MARKPLPPAVSKFQTRRRVFEPLFKETPECENVSVVADLMIATLCFRTSLEHIRSLPVTSAHKLQSL
jgi:hypothetical protein